MQLRSIKFVVIGLLICFGSSLQSEVIFLKNGQKIEGRVVRQSRTIIEITTSKGLISLPKSTIQRIQFVPYTAEQKKQIEDQKQKKLLALQAERDRIEKQKLADAERERQLKLIQDQELAEKQKIAKEQAERAATLRELVEEGQIEKPTDEPISYMDFAWRSMVLPGWGHLTLDRPIVGGAYMGAGALLLYNVLDKRRIAQAAIKENHNAVMMNTVLFAQSSSVAAPIRAGLAQFSNARALTTYQKKVDNYNHSLYLAGAFYGVQLLHIIYNGIAWENGLLIVDNQLNEKSHTKKEGSIQTSFGFTPEIKADGQSLGSSASVAISYYF